MNDSVHNKADADHSKTDIIVHVRFKLPRKGLIGKFLDPTEGPLNIPHVNIPPGAEDNGFAIQVDASPQKLNEIRERGKSHPVVSLNDTEGFIHRCSVVSALTAYAQLLYLHAEKYGIENPINDFTPPPT